jgi:sialic acid synthase SpsE
VTRLFDAKPFVIAEVGSNWETFEHAKDSISLAKNCGADAVKFQAFSFEALHGWSTSIEGDHPYAYELPLSWLPKLKEKADACGIEFMCSAFSPELVEAVDPFVSVHKVASSDLSYPQLLKAVAKTGKPVLLSTGASSRGDIQLALNTLLQVHARPHEMIPLYCVAAYPALQADLRVMAEMEKVWGPVGFSDHTPGTFMAIEAARRGAVVIEKHFTAFPELETPDRPHSLTADEFKIMVDHIRGKRAPVIGPTPEEKAMLLRHNRRLIATKDISTNDKLMFGQNYGAYRSLEDDTRGLSPFGWNDPSYGPEGKRATKAIQRGKAIGPGDFA